MGYDLENMPTQNLLTSTSPTTAYKNSSAFTQLESSPTGLSTGTRSGAPFAGMYDDAAPHEYKNAYTAHPSAAPHPVVPAFEAVPVEEQMKTDLKLKGMKSSYRGEDKDASMLRGSAASWQDMIDDDIPNAPDLKTIATHYMSPTEQKASEVGVKDGKLLDADGKALDTTAATGNGTYNQEAANKHIFAMTGAGEIRQADPWANKKVEERDTGGHVGFVNHSSFTGGKAVAGAGEMRVEKGELQQISDQSGHYQPDGTMVGQTLDALDKKSVNMDMTSVKLVGKGADSNPLFVSPTQFREHDAATAEKEIRDEKKALKSELEAAVAKREGRLNIAAGNQPHDAPVSSYKNG
jgi:hypothetical protein